MQPNRELEPRGLIDDSVENETILSEDALHQLGKSLTKFFPSNVDDLEEGALTYGFDRQAGERY